jgi:alkylation response protein AidB-like acyl-CoA dehydrogenase
MSQQLQWPKLYNTTEELERHLGDPTDPSQPFSYKRSVELDDAEVYPQELIDQINAWGFPKFHVPKPYGGELVSLEQLLSLSRSVSRRDVTIAVASGVSFLGSLPVWLAGSEEQKRKVAEHLLRNGKMGFALSEREHGHDILQNSTQAKPTADGYLLTGEKWTIGHATRAEMLSVYARTNETGGPRGYSFFLVEKQQLDSQSYEHTPKIKTLGLRAHDLSGIRFDNCKIPADALIGKEGLGFELATQSTLITRTLCAGLVLGAADTALRATLNFALDRKLYGDSLFHIHHARTVHVDAFLDLLISDCLATATTRAWHHITDQMSIWGSIVKYMVPLTLEQTIQSLGRVMGARFFLREEHLYGAFQKLYRDVPIVSVFEGGSYAQLQGIALQMRQLLKNRPVQDKDAIRSALRSVFCLNEPIDAFVKRDHIELHSHGQNHALQGLDFAIEQVQELINSRPGDKVPAQVLALAGELQAQYAKLCTFGPKMHTYPDKSADQLELARRYCVLHTAAVCLHTWVWNQGVLSSFFDQGEWLVLSLLKLLRNEVPSHGFSTHPEYVERMADELLHLYEANRLFALVPIQLANANAR